MRVVGRLPENCSPRLEVAVYPHWPMFTDLHPGTLHRRNWWLFPRMSVSLATEPGPASHWRGCRNQTAKAECRGRAAGYPLNSKIFEFLGSKWTLQRVPKPETHEGTPMEKGILWIHLPEQEHRRGCENNEAQRSPVKGLQRTQESAPQREDICKHVPHGRHQGPRKSWISSTQIHKRILSLSFYLSTTTTVPRRDPEKKQEVEKWRGRA